MQDASSMVPIIANASFERLCEVDDYISFIWSRRYYDVGDFELTISAASRNRQHMMQGNYVIRDGLAECGIIEQIEITVDLNNQEVMVVSGRFLSSILGRRIIAQQTQVSGTIESCIKALINQNAISPQNSARRLPNLTYGTWSIPATTMEQQFTGKNLLEVIEDICKTYEIGFRIDLTSSDGFSLVLYSGIDRSYNQTANPYIIFSNDYENLASSDYSENYQSIVTDVLVAGEGEGLSRKTIWASSGNARGLARHELFVDARNASTNNGEISDSVYYAQLREEGLENIAGVTQAFAGEVYLTNFDLGTDFDVGDVVVIENAKWDISANARLIEVIESVSEAGVYTVMPTFAIGGTTIEPTAVNAFVSTESSANLLTEQGAGPLLLESSTFNAASSEYDSAVKISELEESVSLADSDLFAVASGAFTKKVTYNTLKTLLKAYIGGGGGGISLEDVYPVGSIYINASNGTNPATLLGFGTWERLGQGRMMIDADSTHTAGDTGGSESHDHGGNTGSTTLNAAQSGLPAHTHGFTNPSIPNHVHSMTHHHTYQYAGDAAANLAGSNPDNMGNVVRLRKDGSLTGLNTADYTGNTGNPTSLPATTGGAVGAVTGGAKAASSGHDHTISSASNMPPWIGVYMWKRTA